MRYGGDLLPQSAKEYPYRGFVYRVVFADAQPRSAYVRLKTTSSSVLIVKAWEPNQFLAKISGEYALFGLLLGLVLTAILANIWHGLWRREEIYLLRLISPRKCVGFAFGPLRPAHLDGVLRRSR